MIVDVNGRPFKANAYEGANQGPRSRQWHAPSSGPNRVIGSAGATLRNRTRAAYRNSLLMRSALKKNTTSEVGAGFTLMSLCKDEGTKTALNGLWKVVQTQLDPWGDLNFGALVHLAVLSRRMSGEVFIRRVRRRLSAGLAVPTQMEILEADMCPLDLNKRLSQTRRIVQGIEYKGRLKVAIWFYKDHPGDGFGSASLNRLERVPARDVIHHYMPTRPGQVRGEPETAAALVKNQTFHEYNDHELNRKKNRSTFTGFLYREGDGLEESWEFDPNTGANLHEDGPAAYPNEQAVESGTVLRGVPGEKLELFKGDDTGQGYRDYQTTETQMMAAGLEIPHALMTGDWTGLNDRLVRAIMNEHRRGIKFEQSNLSGYQVCKGVWRWIVEDAILTGVISAPGFAQDAAPWLALDARPDAFRHLHPEQEINARIKAINSQMGNVETAAAENGEDLEENMQRNAAALKRWETICTEKGIKNPGNMAGVFANPEPYVESDE